MRVTVGTADRTAAAAGSPPAAMADVPPGLPGWVTPDLLELTLRVWQPYYAETLTMGDAAGMLTGVGRLLSILTDSPGSDSAER